MPQTPIRLLEKAIVSDVLTDDIIPELSGLTVYAGLSADTHTVPRVVCVVADARPAPGFEDLSQEREYVGDLYLGFVASAKGASAADLDTYDARIAAVQEIFEWDDGVADPESPVTLGSLLNKPAGTDNRTVKDLYIYSCKFAGESQDPLEEPGQWQILLRYTIEFKPTDGAAPTP